MTTGPGPQPAAPAPDDDPAARHLAAIGAHLTVGGIACQLRRDGSTPSLTIEDPASGPDGPAVIVDPGLPGSQPVDRLHLDPRPRRHSWRPAAVTITVLAAIRPAPART
jgi:hypothetical protein